MWIGIISLFPKMFHAITDYGIVNKAIKNGLLKIRIWNPRDFTHNKNRIVDDRPYGGGSGMLMMMQPLVDAISAARVSLGKCAKVIYLSPQGDLLDQSGVNKLATNKKLILVCGRYKGIDERVIQTEIDEEWSVGDYILSGGELPAMTVIDSISRLIPGVLGCEDSVKEDSFFNGLLDCPHYTRPKLLGGIEVPAVLRSGNHKEVYLWRLKQTIGRTWLRRPELLNKISLNKDQTRLLEEFKTENEHRRDKINEIK